MRIGIIATLAYGVVLAAIVAALLLTGSAHPHENGAPGALQVLAWCGALLAGGLAPPALAWLVVAVRRLGGALPSADGAATDDAAEDKPSTSSPEAAMVEDRRDFFSTLERYRTSLYNQFIEVFQDTGLIESYRAFKFPDGLPMVDRPCIFLVEHFLALEQKEEPVPERFNLTNEELQILLRMFDEMVSHAKRTKSTFVLRRNDMRVYQMLGGQYP